uniref:Integrase, catalytic region, zinc finger, CCHC-type, peptidase aspartic, catalytic n=1 Tax=Tanacetum cinerariifolium TaxID=118510 RepID=A0A6L2P0Z4_TANCI|nr:hypothetical protein [Tanacetum cinerariifolium]
MSTRMKRRGSGKRLVLLGRENGVNILKLIDEGPFQIGTFKETLTEGEEGALHLGPERARVYSDLSPKDKERLKESNYDQLYVYLKQHEAHANKNKTMLEQFAQHTVDPLTLMSNVSLHQVVVQNVQDRHNRGQGNNTKGTGVAGNERAQNRVRNVNLGQARKIKCYNYNGGQDSAIDEDIDEPPVQDLTLNVDNIFQADECDAFDSDVDEAPTKNTMFMANLSSADPIYDEAGLSYDSDILYETTQCVFVKAHTKVGDASLIAELTTYKEQVELYERRAKFELTEREQKIEEQLRIVITDRNIKEENLKKELHSVKRNLTLPSTITSQW